MPKVPKEFTEETWKKLVNTLDSGLQNELDTIIEQGGKDLDNKVGIATDKLNDNLDLYADMFGVDSKDLRKAFDKEYLGKPDDELGMTMALGGGNDNSKPKPKTSSELRNRRLGGTSELRNKKKKGRVREGFDELLSMGKDMLSGLKAPIIPELAEKGRSLDEWMREKVGSGEGRGIFELLGENIPNTPEDILLTATGPGKAAKPGVTAMAGGVPFFQRGVKLAEKLGIEDSTKFAETLVALRKRIRKGEKVDLGEVDDEVKELLTSGLQRIKGTAPRAKGTAPRTPPIREGQDTYFRVTRSGNIVHVGPNAPSNLKEGEALILQSKSGDQIVAEGNLSSKMKSALDSSDLNSLKPQSYTKRYGSWLDEANKHFQDVKGTDLKSLGEREGALLVEFPNPEGGKWIGTIRNGKLTSAAHTDVPLKDAKGLIRPDEPAGTDILRMVKSSEADQAKDVELLKDHLYAQNPMASGPQTPGFQKSVERYKQKQTGVVAGTQSQTGSSAQISTGQGQAAGQQAQISGATQQTGQGIPKVSKPTSGTSSQVPPSGSGNLPPASQRSGTGSAPSSPTQAPKQKPPKKHPTADVVRNALGTFKTAKSVLDLPVGRHAIVESLAHPLEVGGPSLAAGLKATFSPKAHDKIQMDVLQSLGNMENDLIDRLVIAGVDTKDATRLADRTFGKLNLNDLLQQFPSQWLEQIPGAGKLVKASERGYTSSLNTARTNRLSQILRNNPDASVDDIGGAINMVNDFTGAGDLGRLEPVADIAAAGMFSPRLLSSRIAMLNPANYIRNQGSNLGLLKEGTKWGGLGKQEALKDMLKFGGVVGGGLGAASLLGDEDVETDPRSSDFLSPQSENTTWDIYGGMRPLVNTTARLATGQTKRPWGEIQNQPRSKTAINFARSKLAPGPPSMLGDIIFGEDKKGIERDLSGDPIWETEEDFGKWIGNQIVPMYPTDIFQAFEDLGPVRGTLSALAGVTGIGAQTYPRKKKEKRAGSSRSVDIIK